MIKKILILMFLSSTSFAASELYQNNDEIKEILNTNVYEPNYFTMFLGLLFVLLLVYLTGFVYQKLIKVKLTNETIENKIDIISTTSLGQGRNVHVIKVNEEYLLVGATQNNITYLKELNKSGFKKD